MMINQPQQVYVQPQQVYVQPQVDGQPQIDGQQPVYGQPQVYGHDQQQQLQTPPVQQLSQEQAQVPQGTMPQGMPVVAAEPK